MSVGDYASSAAARLHFWRGLDELAGADAPAPTSAEASPIALPRRDFLKLMSASMALATAGCGRAPPEKIVPYRDGPAQDGYGKPVFYATALVRDGYGCGVLVETNMGRPTKIEGNPAHPASLGATDIFAQAAVLELWDPDRSTAVRRGAAIDAWPMFVTDLQAQLRGTADGRGLAILTETVMSPTLHDQLTAIRARHPQARWHQYQPVNRDNVHEGAVMAGGSPAEPRYRYADARVIVALDADIVGTMPGAVRHAHDIAGARRSERASNMSRLHVAEGSPSLTGALADQRCVVRTGDIAVLAERLAARIGAFAAQAGGAASADEDAATHAWLEAAVADLAANRGRAIVVAGDRQPAAVHAHVRAINRALGNDGATVIDGEPIALESRNHVASLRALVDSIARREVTTLLILGGNPAWNAPRDLAFASALRSVPWSAHLALYDDETSAACTWHVPAAHTLEAWGDVRAFDGSVTIQQPCIAPLYDGKSAYEMLSVMQDGDPQHGLAIVRAFWQRRHPVGFESFWRESLWRGIVTADVGLAPDTAAPSAAAPPGSVPAPKPTSPAERRADDVELVLAPDPTLGDGRHANNAWLQELPKPLTTLTWDNAALVAPAFAARRALANGDVVELRAGDSSVRVPIWTMPGHADNAVTLHLGSGRVRAGSVGDGVGVDAYPLWASATRDIVPNVTVTAAGAHRNLAVAQAHSRMEGRDLARMITRDAAARCETGACTPAHDTEPHGSLYPPVAYDGYKWAMNIDQGSCIGCAACTIACQAENNIPVVGREEVLRGREMHWIRVDRYYTGSAAAPRTLFQPVPCMQCEHAPCEEVCPVEASVHDAEGLNVQVYNRCVGTRFCSNNCPYKVRRFNWLSYTQSAPAPDAQRNPEVTVRMRGVMEKCTYCIQRIERARSDADRDSRRIADGDVVTACQAACPTQAIVFGDLNDRSSRVVARKASALDYALLAELNTRPRTTYLPKVVNASAADLHADSAPTPGGGADGG